MENTALHSSCISLPASGEISWAMHFAGFLASPAHSSDQEMDHQGGGAYESSFCSGFSSSFDSFLSDDEGDDSFITSDLMDEDDEDDSLQDTACSSGPGPKVGNKELQFSLLQLIEQQQKYCLSSRSNIIFCCCVGNQHE
jgi:hypothetical protein